MEEVTTKKTWVLGDKTKNHATITEERRNPNSIHALAAKDHIERAATLTMPTNSKYLGSACVHYFEKGSKSNGDYFTVEQVYIGKVDEHLADFGWKRLRAALMRAFGRKETKERA